MWSLRSYQRLYGFLLLNGYYGIPVTVVCFFTPFFQYFSSTMEKEVEKSIELELKRNCDKMKIGQKQIE